MIASPIVNEGVPIPSGHPVANREDHVSTSSIKPLNDIHLLYPPDASNQVEGLLPDNSL